MNDDLKVLIGAHLAPVVRQFQRDRTQVAEVVVAQEQLLFAAVAPEDLDEVRASFRESVDGLRRAWMFVDSKRKSSEREALVA